MKPPKKINNTIFPDMDTAISATECTGLIPSAPQTDEEYENSLAIMKFSPKDAQEN